MLNTRRRRGDGAYGRGVPQEVSQYRSIAVPEWVVLDHPVHPNIPGMRNQVFRLHRCSER